MLERGIPSIFPIFPRIGVDVERCHRNPPVCRFIKLGDKKWRLPNVMQVRLVSYLEPVHRRGCALWPHRIWPRQSGLIAGVQEKPRVEQS
jgi:hypothetical protein